MHTQVNKFRCVHNFVSTHASHLLLCNLSAFVVYFLSFSQFQMALYKGKKCDPNKPKRPMTAYFIFSGDFRIKMKNRGVDHKEILRLGMSALIHSFQCILFWGSVFSITAGVRLRTVLSYPLFGHMILKPVLLISDLGGCGGERQSTTGVSAVVAGACMIWSLSAHSTVVA